MKYKYAKVISHPRAGSHYLAKLLNENFFNKDNYLDLYGGHSKSHLESLNKTDTAVFYIFREKIENSLKSMFRLRKRFGITTDSYTKFLESNLKDIHSSVGRCEIALNGKVFETNADSFLASINKTPKVFIKDHQDYFLNIYNSNYFVLSYEDLTENFEYTMERIAKFLGSDKTKFVNIEKKVGWYDPNDAEL